MRTHRINQQARYALQSLRLGGVGGRGGHTVGQHVEGVKSGARSAHGGRAQERGRGNVHLVAADRAVVLAKGLVKLDADAWGLVLVVVADVPEHAEAVVAAPDIEMATRCKSGGRGRQTDRVSGIPADW